MDYDSIDQKQVRAKVEQMFEDLTQEAAREKLEPMEAYDRLLQREDELAQEFGIDSYSFGQIITRVLARRRDIFKTILYP